MNIQPPKYLIELSISNVQLSTSKQHLEENNKSEFQIKINVSKDNTVFSSNYSKKVLLKDSLMYFDDNKIILTNIDDSSDIEIIPIVHSNTIITYDTTYKQVSELKKNVKFDDLWILKHPTKSFIKLKILIKESTENETELPNKEDTNKNRSHNELFQIKKILMISSPVKEIGKAKTISLKKLIENKEEVPNLENQISNRNLEKTPTTDLNNHKKRKSLFLSPTQKKREINKVQVISTSNPFPSSPSKVKFQEIKLEDSKDKNFTSKFSSSSSLPNNNENLNPPQIKNTNHLKILESESRTINKNMNEDNFCEYFFSVSLPTSNQIKIEGSEKFSTSCGHSTCSNFHSYRAIINQSFPENDLRKLEINSIIANLCFPKGIRLCFGSPNNQTIKPTQNFLIVNTNEDGTRYYIMTYHYYIRLKIKEFEDKYEFSPMNNYLDIETQNKELEANLSSPEKQKKIEADIETKLKFCSEYYFSDYVYVPNCICLVSKFPFAKQMEKCLEIIFRMFKEVNFNENEILSLIKHLVKEIPVPTSNKRLLFYAPYQLNPIEIYGPIQKNLPLLNFNLGILIERLTIENIMTIHYLMLCEQKILFVGQSISTMTEILEGFIALLYPLQWTYPYIPNLSEELLKYLQTPLPFVMGIDSSMLQRAKEFLQEEDEIYLCDVTKNIVTRYQLKDKKIPRNELLKSLPPFPPEIEKDILTKLREITKTIKESKMNSFVVDKKIRKIFIHSMAKMFGNYHKYLTMLDRVPLFNKESFLQNYHISDKKFLEKFLESQIFNYFLQLEIKEDFPYFHKICLRYSNTQKSNSAFKRSNSINNTSFSPKKSNHFRKSGINFELPKHEKIDNNSLIRHSISNLNASENSTTSISSQKDIKTNEYAENFLVPPYFLPDSVIASNLYELEEIIQLKFKDSSVIQDNTRILDKQIKLDFSKVKEYNRYIIDQEKDESKKKQLTQKLSSNKGLIDLKFIKEADALIEDCLRSIFTSEDILEEKKKELMSMLSSKDARKIFSRLVFQKKFKDNKIHLLSESSFKILSTFVCCCLNEFKTNEINEIQMITKALFFYSKLINKKQYFLYQDAVKKCQNTGIWRNVDLWNEWFEKEKKEILISENCDDQYFNMLLFISKLMHDLNMDKDFVCDVIVDNIGKKHFLKDLIIEDLRFVIKKQFDQEKLRKSSN